MPSVGAVIARNVRRVRTARGMSLSELAQASGVAKATLSSLERGSGNPTIATMYAVADALRTPLGELITERKPDPTLVRAADGPQMRRGDVSSRYIGRIQVGRDLIEIYELQIASNKSAESQPHRPGVIEYIFVTKGPIVAGPSEASIELHTGDYLAFRADIAHRYMTTGDHNASALCLVHYPSVDISDTVIALPTHPVS